MTVASTVGSVAWAGLKRALLYAVLFGLVFSGSAVAANYYDPTPGWIWFLPAAVFLPAYVLAGAAFGFACGAVAGVTGRVHLLVSLANARLGPAMERLAARVTSRGNQDRDWLETKIPLQDLNELLSGEHLLRGALPKNALTLWLVRRAFDAAEVVVVKDIVAECERAGRDHITGADFESAVRSRLVDLAVSQIRTQLSLTGYGFYALSAAALASVWVLRLIE